MLEVVSVPASMNVLDTYLGQIAASSICLKVLTTSVQLIHLLGDDQPQKQSY